MAIKKTGDTRYPNVFTHKLADIPGGVAVKASEIGIGLIKEGTPIGKDSNGLFHVVKQALVQANASNSATDIKIYKGHDFKVGTVVCAAENGKAYAITAIDRSNAAYDQITVGTTLGVALTADVSVLYEAAEAAASGSALKYKPIALVGETQAVDTADDLYCSAWTIGQVKGGNALLGSVVTGYLTKINVI